MTLSKIQFHKILDVVVGRLEILVYMIFEVPKLTKLLTFTGPFTTSCPFYNLNCGVH
jgi:hypothetical protein